MTSTGSQIIWDKNQDQKEYNEINLKLLSGHNDEINSVAFSSDFEMIVTGSDDFCVRIFKATTGDQLVKLTGHEGPVNSVVISPNSKLIASCSQDNTVRIWRTRDVQCLFVLRGHSKSVECLAFSTDSSLLCSGSWDKTAILWNVQDGSINKIFSEHGDLVQSVAFSHDSNTLATGSWDKIVRVWSTDIKGNLATTEGNVLLQQMSGHLGNIRSVAYSKAGMLASGSWDKTIRLWNPRNGKCLFTLLGHTGWVQSVSFSADSVFLASASDDDTVRIWDCTTGSCVKELDQPHTDQVSLCAFGSRDVLFVSGSASFFNNSELD